MLGLSVQAFPLDHLSYRIDAHTVDFSDTLKTLFLAKILGGVNLGVNGRVKVSQMAAQNVATLGLARLPRE